MGGDDEHGGWDRNLRRRLRPAFAQVWSYLVVHDDPAGIDVPLDALFCFGSRHDQVPLRAAAAYHAGLAPVVLCTGGPSRPGERTEAARFADVLRHRGVPADRIVVEPWATNTGENVRYGLTALQTHRPDRTEPVRRLALVGWPLSARRCRATFARWAPRICTVSLPAVDRPAVAWEPTPELTRWALGELVRLRRYGDFGFIVTQDIPTPVLDAALTLLAHLTPDPAPTRPVGSPHHPPGDRVVTAGTSLVAQDTPLLDVQTLRDLLGDRSGEIPVRLRPPARIEQVQPTAG